MKHLKLFEGYFEDKRKDLQDAYNTGLQDIRDEFTESARPYVNMLTDEFDNIDIVWPSEQDTDISDPNEVNISLISKSSKDLDKISDMYDNLTKIKEIKDDFKTSILFRISGGGPTRTSEDVGEAKEILARRKGKIGCQVIIAISETFISDEDEDEDNVRHQINRALGPR